MRNAGKELLPKASAEEEKDYAVRLTRSFLFNAYWDTLKRLADKPFSNPVVVTKPPEQLMYLLSDVDACGTDLSSFARSLLEDGINFGLFHVLVDYTDIPEDQRDVSIAEEKDLGARAVLMAIRPSDLVGYQTEKRRGESVLTMIRFRYSVLENDGEFGQQEANYVKVITEDTWSVYKENDKQEFILDSAGTHTFGSVPLYTGYINRTGFMLGEPALMPLAEKNIEHWQSASEQRHILGFSRFAILFGKGYPQSKGNMKVGPSNMVHTEEENADLKYVEPQGNAIEAGKKDLDSIKQEMEQLGAEPLISRTGKETATGQGINEGNATCELKSWIREVRTAVVAILGMAAEWHDTELGEEFDVEIYKDFSVALAGSKDVDVLIKLKKEKSLSCKTLLKEAQRRGLISENIDIDAEIEEIQEELNNSFSAMLQDLPLEDEVDDGEE